MGHNDMKKCSSCGKEMTSDAAFCTNCGKRFEEKIAAKKCSSCGKEIEPEATFCTNCGKRFEEKKMASAEDPSSIGKKLMELENEFLAVREINPLQFEFSSQTGAQAPVQKVKIKYNAVAQLDPEQKRVTFWEKMVESSVGMNTGAFVEKKVQKGIEVGKKIDGRLLFGGKYGFEYGQLRDVVKALAAEQGWQFKTVVFKPGQNKKNPLQDVLKMIPHRKIVLPVLAFLLLAVIGTIFYCSFSDGSGKGQTQGAFEGSPSEDADSVASQEDNVFQQAGTVAGGKPFIQTDKDVYRSGEKIRVNYYNAPGQSRDWICIVRAGAANTEAGDYQYIPRRGRGVLTFRAPRPGKYEARAYYNYSSFDYRISARYGFTVAD
ncbi:MAG: zinc ribbon domain-containing protein [Smithella sp.]|nr:zinc ribbon domain-containing protein [Smithella sp.]